MMKSWYGCRPDTKDQRDRMLVARRGPVLDTVDLRQWAPPVMDQEAIGSCTAHGVTAAARFNIIKRATTYDFEMSRLQLYYDTRADEGTEASDAGAEIRDVIKMLATNGVGHEDLWPYDVSRFAEEPSQPVYDDAVQYKALVYERVDVSAMGLKMALSAGHPVIIGVSIYESFEGLEVEHSGMVPMPRASENMMGGHCMLCLGYDQRGFIVRNSWGPNWGDEGNCYFPAAYLGSQTYGNDYWVVDVFGSEAEKQAGTA